MDLKSRIIRELRVRLAIDRGGLDQAVVLAGAGRSGTTWLADMLSLGGGLRLIFEPLHPNLAPSVGHFSPRQYVRRGNRDSQWIRPVERMLSGKVRSRWTCRQNVAWYASGRLIKVVRANLLLPWLHEAFPEVKIVFVMRNPCAVSLSRLNLGWAPFVDELLKQNELMNDYLEPFRSRLESARNDFEKHVLLWCAEHYVPLQTLSEKDMLIVSYESFCKNPAESFDRLFAFAGVALRSDISSAIDRPSTVTPDNSAVYTGEDKVSSWKRKIQPVQWDFVNETLTAFRLDTYYNPEGEYIYESSTNRKRSDD